MFFFFLHHHVNFIGSVGMQSWCYSSCWKS